jgi:signal transduction histidine kinase
LKNFGERLEALVRQRTAALQEEITEHQQAREAIHDLTARLSAAEDSERRRLAHDIHDSLSQNLSVLKLNLQGAASRLGNAARPDGPLGDTVKMVDDLIDQTRTLTFDLHPAMLDDLGLAPTLNWFAEQFHRRTQVEVTISEVGERRPLPQALANYIFRSVKELINNAAKHGKAQEVVVAIHWRLDRLRIVVDDDGGGFDSASALAPQTRRGLGLAGIQERLASLNGNIHIESAVGHGTRVILEVAAAANISTQSAHHDNPNPVG